MASIPHTFLDKLLGRVVKYLGVEQNKRSAINFAGAGVTVTDDDANDQTTVTINAASATGTQFTLDGSSAPLVAGDWVSPLASDPTKVTRATPTVALAAGSVVGCVKASVAAGAQALVFGPGAVVPASNFSDLTGSGVSALQMLTSGRANRTILSGGEIRLGATDPSGNVVVDTFVPVKTAPTHTYNPKSYGAAWDGAVDANGQIIAGHDDTPAWDAMMAAIPMGTQAKIVLPPGYGYMAGTPWAHGPPKVSIKRYCHIEGNGGGCQPEPNQGISSGFLLPPLVQIVFDGTNSSSDGGTGQYADFEHVTVLTKTPIVADQFASLIYSCLGNNIDNRASGRFVELGMVVVYSGATVAVSGNSRTDPAVGTHNSIMFRCTHNGTPTGGEPAAFGTATVANIGNTITDTGGVTWVVEGVPKDRISSHAYGVGERFYLPGDNRFIYEVTIAGTSGNDAARDANASFVQPQPWKTFADGGCTVKVIIASPVLVTASTVRIRHCAIEGGFGFGVHVDSGQFDDTHYLFADFAQIVDTDIWFSGGGVHIHGNNSSASNTRQVRYFGSSVQQRTSKGDSRIGTGEFAVWDRVPGGCTHQGNYAQFGKAAGYVTDSAGTVPVTLHPPGSATLLYDCRSENAFPDVIFAPAIKIGTGVMGESTDSTAMILTATHSRGLVGTETDSQPKATAYAVQQLQGGVVSFGIQAGGDSGLGNWNGWWTDKVNVTSIGTGWLAFANGPGFNGSFTLPRASFGVTYWDAKNTGGGPGPGVGLMRIWDGWFNRALDSYYATDVGMLTNAKLRYGSRVVGDSFPIPGATGAVGTFRRCVVTTAGYRGLPWAGGLTYYVEGDTFAQEALLVEPSTSPAVFTDGTTRVWKYTGSLTNNGVEPIWPGSGNFTDAHGNTWVDMGVTAIVEPSDFIDDKLIGETPQTRLAWQDTAATQGTACPKEYVKSYRFQTATTTSGTNQALYTLPDDFPDNATCLVSVQVKAKRNGNHASYMATQMTCYRGRNNAAAPEDGGDTLSTATWGAENSLTGLTLDLHDSSNTAVVRVNNPPAYQVDWGIVVQVDVRQS